MLGDGEDPLTPVLRKKSQKRNLSRNSAFDDSFVQISLIKTENHEKSDNKSLYGATQLAAILGSGSSSSRSGGWHFILDTILHFILVAKARVCEASFAPARDRFTVAERLK